MVSLKGHRRKQLMSSRTGSHNGSLWLCYSPKIDKDLTIISDREMVYWVSELESNPKVRSFEFDAEVEVCLAPGSEAFECIKCTWVDCADGTVELHVIDSRENVDKELKAVDIRCRRSGQPERDAQVVRIPHVRLVLVSKFMGFWLQVIAFAAQVRGYDLEVEIEILDSQITLDKEGTIRDLLSSVSIQDQALAIGAISRMILKGAIQVEVGSAGFGNHTQWRLP